MTSLALRIQALFDPASTCGVWSDKSGVENSGTLWSSNHVWNRNHPIYSTPVLEYQVKEYDWSILRNLKFSRPKLELRLYNGWKQLSFPILSTWPQQVMLDCRRADGNHTLFQSQNWRAVRRCSAQWGREPVQRSLHKTAIKLKMWAKAIVRNLESWPYFCLPVSIKNGMKRIIPSMSLARKSWICTILPNSEHVRNLRSGQSSCTLNSEIYRWLWSFLFAQTILWINGEVIWSLQSSWLRQIYAIV